MKLVSPKRSNRSLAKPEALRVGDTIALVAPASPPLSTGVISKMKKRLESLGFSVMVGKNCGKKNGYLAGSDRERLADLHAAFEQRSVKAVFCVRGGYGMARILSSVKLPVLAKTPKIVVGCSDITALLSASVAQAGVVAFHGPMAQSLVDESCPDFTWRSLLSVLMKDDSSLGSILRGYEEESSTVVTLRRGIVTAPLIGGNLSILLSLLGTAFFPSLDGKIVCLEDIAEKPYRIDRMLTQLLAVGAFDSVAGFAFGVFKDCEYDEKGVGRLRLPSLQEVIFEKLAKLKKPIVMGLPFGHIPFNSTLPLGVKATLQATKGDLIIEEFGVR